MTLKSALLTVLVAVAGLAAGSAMSEEVLLEMEAVGIQNNSEAEVKAACEGYFGLKNSQGRYVCINKNGKGIMCGGLTDEENQSCHTFQLESGGDLLMRVLAAPRPTESEEIFDPQAGKCCVKIGGDKICKRC